MSTFKDADDLYATMGAFLADVVTRPEMKPKFLASGTSFRVRYDDPEAQIVVDCTQDPPRVICGPSDTVPEIDLGMSADNGHKFWCGSLNMTVALAKKQVSVSGPMSKMMKLLPAMRPAFPMYREFLETHGHADKLAS